MHDFPRLPSGTGDSVYGSGTWFIATLYGKSAAGPVVETSIDGTTWKEHSTTGLENNAITGLASGNGTLLAATELEPGANGFPPPPQFFQSSDGISWTARSSVSGAVTALAFGSAPVNNSTQVPYPLASPSAGSGTYPTPTPTPTPIPAQTPSAAPGSTSGQVCTCALVSSLVTKNNSSGNKYKLEPHAYVWSGPWISAGAINVSAGEEVTAVFHFQGGAWVPVNRGPYCDAYTIPADIYEVTCHSN